ncbi:hypothetical protein EVAR_87866_1 [Eumeta japonica]|uniref:Uncharacterized protein n=1 Tax=Eumeta variegata TaxID=151549 RepID=A0A4C1WXI9_EUMVA|nr:hypothetical protein EVAR_87866_1 [Eumeta japonica]
MFRLRSADMEAVTFKRTLSFLKGGLQSVGTFVYEDNVICIQEALRKARLYVPDKIIHGQMKKKRAECGALLHSYFHTERFAKSNQTSHLRADANANVHILHWDNIVFRYLLSPHGLPN